MKAKPHRSCIVETAGWVMLWGCACKNALRLKMLTWILRVPGSLWCRECNVRLSTTINVDLVFYVCVTVHCNNFLYNKTN